MSGYLPDGVKSASDSTPENVKIVSSPNMERAWRMDALNMAIKNLPGQGADKHVIQAKIYEEYLTGSKE